MSQLLNCHLFEVALNSFVTSSIY